MVLRLPLRRNGIKQRILKPENNERSLLEGLARNNRSAVETIYKENFGMVQTLIINNNGTVDEAKDIFQEAMIVLYEKSRSANFELTCLIKTYLYSVSRRLWLKKLNQANRYVSISDEGAVPVEDDVDHQQTKNDQFEIMHKAISELREPCKGLLQAYYLQKKSMQEIAVEFGYTNPDNAKNQKYKCLMRLKKIFFTQYKNGGGDE